MLLVLVVSVEVLIRIFGSHIDFHTITMFKSVPAFHVAKNITSPSLIMFSQVLVNKSCIIVIAFGK